MAAPSEVRVKIRHNVLILETFTVPQLRSITGLNRQSIYSEIGRMEREDLISRVGIEKRKKGTAGGRPQIVYQLTSDPEKRFEVLQSVRAFYVETEEPSLEPLRPESKHYFIVKEILEEAIQEETALTRDKRVELLAQIQKRLEYARREEKVGEEGTELIATSLAVLEAKAIDALAGDWEQAVELLDEARRVCQELIGADDLVSEIQAYVQAIAAHMAEDQLKFDERRKYEKVEEMADNLRVIKHRFGDLPGISTYFKQAKRLVDKMREERISAQAEQRAIQLVANAWNQERRVLIDRIPWTIEERVYFVGSSSETRFLTSGTWAASTLALLQRQLPGTAGGVEQPAQTDDLEQQLFRSVQVQGSEELKK
jgi:predicted ArsR family transcriptional regulator